MKKVYPDAKAALSGLLKDGSTELVDTLKTGFKQVSDSLKLVARGLGVEIPDAVEQAQLALDGLPREIPIDINVNYNDPGFTPNGGDYSQGVPSFANGGVEGFL